MLSNQVAVSNWIGIFGHIVYSAGTLLYSRFFLRESLLNSFPDINRCTASVSISVFSDTYVSVDFDNIIRDRFVKARFIYTENVRNTVGHSNFELIDMSNMGFSDHSLVFLTRKLSVPTAVSGSGSRKTIFFSRAC